VNAPLHLVSCPVYEDKLFAFAARYRGARMKDFDEGYAVHALMAAVFDHGLPQPERVAPKPFRVVTKGGGWIEVLGYSTFDHRELAERARSLSDPGIAKVFEIDRLASKPMPSTFELGARLRFSVRACPIRRIAKRGPMTRERCEVDAFLAQSWEVGGEQDLDRNEVYREWLGEELRKEGASALLQAEVTRFQLVQLHRRTQAQERETRWTARPDVTFEGTLEVRDAPAFMRRLARGVGRHRAFGFGMLLLAPG
jgi:CRISPR system Cascade subunit CasE